MLLNITFGQNNENTADNLPTGSSLEGILILATDNVETLNSTDDTSFESHDERKITIPAYASRQKWYSSRQHKVSQIARRFDVSVGKTDKLFVVAHRS